MISLSTIRDSVGSNALFSFSWVRGPTTNIGNGLVSVSHIKDKHIEAGISTGNVATSVSVNFNIPYNTPPIVFVQNSAMGRSNISLSNVTTSGFVVHGMNTSNCTPVPPQFQYIVFPNPSILFWILRYVTLQNRSFIIKHELNNSELPYNIIITLRFCNHTK